MKFLFVILSEAKDLKQRKVKKVQNEILRLSAQNDNRAGTETRPYNGSSRRRPLQTSGRGNPPLQTGRRVVAPYPELSMCARRERS